MQRIAYNKSSKRKSKYAIGAPKGKTPSRSCNLRKGVLFSAYGLPKPLPLGEVSPKVTERASPAGKSLCVAIGRLFVGAILSQCRAVWQRPCPLSRAYARQLPQRGSHWQAGPLSTGRLRPDMAQKGGPCYRGQHLLDKRTLSSCRWPRQRSTTVPETSCFARPA